MRPTWKRRAGKLLRDLAYWIDPPAKPGRKRRKAVAAEEPMLLDHGWPEEPADVV